MWVVSNIVKLAFSTYTILLFIAIMGSWFPGIAHTRFMRFVRCYVDPYLNLFRRFIPTIGGVLDLSPLLALMALSVLEKIIMSFLQ